MRHAFRGPLQSRLRIQVDCSKALNALELHETLNTQFPVPPTISIRLMETASKEIVQTAFTPIHSDNVLPVTQSALLVQAKVLPNVRPVSKLNVTAFASTVVSRTSMMAMANAKSAMGNATDVLEKDQQTATRAKTLIWMEPVLPNVQLQLEKTVAAFRNVMVAHF